MKRIGKHAPSVVVGAAFALLAGGLFACSSEQPKPNSNANNPAAQAQGQPSGPAAANSKAPAARPEEQKQEPGQAADVGAQPPSRDKLGVIAEAPTTSRIPTERTVIQGQQIPTVTTTRVGADINRMNADDFKALGTSGDLAQSIIQYRDAHGPFKSVKDLGRVPNMDQGWLADNQQRLAVTPNSATG